MKRFPIFLIVLILAITAQAGALNPVTQQWVQTFHAPYSGDNLPNGVAVDNRGNVFVVGYELVSNVYPRYDFVSLKYSPSGVPLWTNYYDGPAHLWDQAYAMALDRAGNLFVTGNSQIGPTPFTFNYVTIKYSNNGMPLWTNYYNGLTNADAQALTMAVDHSSGAVYVSGIFSFSDSVALQYVTIKYSNAGMPLWTNSFTAATDGFFPDARPFLASGKNGKLFLTGTVRTQTSGEDYVTLAYSSNGKPLWTNYYSGPTNADDHVAGIAVDNRDNVFVTGSSQDVGDFVTISYSANGTPVWTNIFNAPAGGGGIAKAIAVNNRGDVFVTGDTTVSTNNDDSSNFGTVAYSGGGIPLWTNYYAPTTNDDEPFAIATDLNRAVFVTGLSYGTGTGPDYATVEYSSGGVPISTNRYNGPANDDDEADAIAVGPNGAVYVTGYSVGTNTGHDITTIKYSTTRGSH